MVKKKGFSVRWAPKAKVILDDFCDQVEKTSGRVVAKRVRTKFVRIAGGLGYFPRKFPQEELLAELEGEFRSVPVWSFKMIYQVADSQVTILYLFHTRRHPTQLLKEIKG